MNSDQDRQELDNSVQQISTSLLKMIDESEPVIDQTRDEGQHDLTPGSEHSLTGIQSSLEEENFAAESMLNKVPVHHETDSSEPQYPHLLTSQLDIVEMEIDVACEQVRFVKKHMKETLDELQWFKWKLSETEKENEMLAQKVDSLKTQLENPGLTFKEKITQFEREAAERENSMKRRIRETLEEYKRLELKIDGANKEREIMEKKCAQDLYLLTSQLESERLSSQVKIKQIENDAKERVSSTEERAKKILEEYKELEFKLSKAEKEKQNLDQKYAKEVNSLNCQLEKQELDFKEKVRQIVKDAEKQVSSTEEREKKILEEYKELELKAEQEKKNLDQKYTKVVSKVDKLDSDLKEEREFNKSLHENQKFLQEKLKQTEEAREQAEKEVNDLQEQLADLMRHLETQQAIASQPDETRRELEEGQIVLGERPSSSRRSKRNRRKK